MRTFLTVAALSVLAMGSAQAALPHASYKLVKTIAIGAPDHWDYVAFDSGARRAYIAHGDVVTVVDVPAGKVAGTLKVGGVTHGVVTTPALGKGYTDDGKSGTVMVFDLKTLKPLGRIKAEPDADGIVYDPQGGRVLVITGDSGKVVVIDPKTDTVKAEIDGGGPLEFGVLDGHGKFYVDGEEKNEIVRMDLASAKADAHWPLTGCKTPHGLAIDRAHMRLFASCGNGTMDVMDAVTGKVLATLPIGAGTDGAAFDARRGLAFSSNRDGTLSVIAQTAPGKFAALAPVKTQNGARTMTLDPASGRIFLVASDVTENRAAAPDSRARFKVVPDSARLVILQPE
jgi:YVTN family beta-propeller protein